MAYTPTVFTKGDTNYTVVTSWREHFQLLWDGWHMGGPAPAPDPAITPAHLSDLATLARRGSQGRTDLGLGTAATKSPAEIAADPALNAAYARKGIVRDRRLMPRPALVRAVMATPPTIGALATSTAIASAAVWTSVTSFTPGVECGTPHFAYRGAGKPTIMGTSFPDYDYVMFRSLTTTNGTASYCADFMFDGTALELKFKGSGGSYRLKVDGEYVSLSPTSVGSTGSTYFLPITFATAKPRLISFEAANLPWGGVVTGPNDSIWKPSTRSPRVIVVGDSFTEGSGADGGAATNWVRAFADVIGWGDCWTSGVGGTGYLNPGPAGRVKFRDRLTNDVTSQNPDIVIWAGGINDYGSGTTAQIQAEVAACYAAVAAANPGALQIALSPFWKGGVGGYPTLLLAARDAIKTEIQNVGGYFVDVLEMPVSSPAVSTTLSAAAASGANSVQVSGYVGRRTTLKFVDGQRRFIINTSGSGPTTLTLDTPLTAALASGSAVNEVGPGFWTGYGRVGSTTGSGNADVYVSSDATHPTQRGHDALGYAVAQLIARQVFGITIN
jgi:lysophospholipase L1-like esterase